MHHRLKSCNMSEAKCFPGTLTLENTFLSKIHFKNLTQLNRTDNMACYTNDECHSCERYSQI